MKITLKLMSLTALFVASSVFAEVPCKFSESEKSFEGTRTEQAECLLRPVLRFAKLGKQQKLPDLLWSKIDKDKVDITATEFKSYLNAYQISESDIGGPIAKPLNLETRYFIIHDTSYNQGAKPFPSNADTTWSGNDLSKAKKVAHVFINRRGESVTKVDFSENYRTTKFENQKISRRNMFVSVELIQPRRSYPEGSNTNDAIAPTPGFTEQQLTRLAVIYFASSIRAGHYLIPAYHAVLDAGIPDGHDDPQNFDLARFDIILDRVLFDIRGGPDAP